MKKMIFSLLLILIPTLSFSQANPGFNRTFSFQGTGNSPVIPLQGLGLNFIKLSWDITGPVGSGLSACAFSLQGSKDSTNFGTTHDSVSNCTNDGQNRPVSVSGSTSQLRINVSSFTSSGGNPTLSVTIAAWDEIIGLSGGTGGDPIHVVTSPDVLTATSTLAIQGPQTASNVNGTITRNQTQFLSNSNNCYYILNIQGGSVATGTLQIYIEDSSDGGTTFDDLISSNTFTYGAAAITQRFMVSGTILAQTVTAATATNVTQGGATTLETLGAGSARQGPWGDVLRVREKVSGVAGSPVGPVYTINAICK